MASIKPILRNKPNSEGKYPLAIQIIKDRKSVLIYLGQYVDKAQWDAKNHRVKKSHPSATRINNLLIKKTSEANNKLIQLELEGKPITASGLKEVISKKSTKDSFFAYASVYVDNLEKSEKYNQLSSDRPRIKHFKEFLKAKDIRFQEITPTLLRGYAAYLKSERRVSKRTIVNHWVVIRTIFNMAMKDRPELNKYYPFGKGGISIKFPDTKKIGLTEEEVKRIEDLDLQPMTSIWHARNIWLIAFYFAGMRISDVLTLKWKDLTDGRLHYSMSKNDKVGSLKIPDRAKQIIMNYKTEKSNVEDYVFPELQSKFPLSEKTKHSRIRTATKKFNDYLRKVAELTEISKPLTNHIARHTFGNISGDKIPPHMLQKLYRHSSLTTTLNYQGNFIYKDADDALEAVIGN